MAPVIWSAIAASLAAVAALVMMLIQRQNLRESIRPELVLDGWSHITAGQGSSAYDIIAFQTVRNVGQGAALHINLDCHHEIDNYPTAGMSTRRLAILAPGESHNLNGEIIVYWKNVSGDSGSKSLSITVKILCWNSRSVVHETLYKLRAVELAAQATVQNPIAPGVLLTTRTPTAPALWVRRTLGQRLRLEGFARFVKRAWALIAITGVVLLLGLGTALYFSEAFQEGKVSGTATIFVPDSTSTGIVGPLRFWVEEIGLDVEICNHSRFRLDYAQWRVNGYSKGRSSAHNIKTEQEAASSGWLFSDDHFIQAGECRVTSSHGYYRGYLDSLKVVFMDIRLNGAPW